MRRRDTPIPHREFFRAVTIDETVALACTCGRGVDHWYAEPMRGPAADGTRLGTRVHENEAPPSAGGAQLSSRAPTRSPERADRAL